MSQQVLHLDFLKLSPDTASEQRSQLDAAAAELRRIAGVLGVGEITGAAGSDFDVAYWFLLREFTALEPFGTHPAYAQFLQRSVAPLITGFAGADVTLSDDFEGGDGAAACLALMGPEEAYDFEVREALEAWATVAEASSAAIGVAVGEKQQYRGAAIALGVSGAERPEIEPFRATLIQGIARVLA